MSKKENKKIQVMIVDDSLTMRLLLQGIISEAPDMEVIATAADPLQAIEEMKTIQPDVMTLDVEMPNMDGISFLQKIMNLKPLPVVMVSTLTSSGSETALKALDIGAVDVIGKPSAIAEDLKASVDEIISKVRAAACARVGIRKPRKAVQNIERKEDEISPKKESHTDYGIGDIDELLPKSVTQISEKRPTIIAIGASTGGPQALQEVLLSLSVDSPPIVITQHIAKGFASMFAKRLNTICDLEIVEAKNNTPIKRGHVYIAPSGKHLTIKYGLNGYTCQLIEGPSISRHIPSVDVLFRSLADNAGADGMAIILTGMGNDGARSLKEVKDAGGETIAQDEESCIVFGMPKMAIKLGGANKILPLNKIAKEIN